MNNLTSGSFPAYYGTASYYDSDFTMTLNGAALSKYSLDLVALVDNGVLNIYCHNDWCKVYHLSNGQSDPFDIVRESGGLSEGDVVLHGSRYYHIAHVSGNNATYDSSSVAYTYTLCEVYNGKIITTQKDYFGSEGMSFYVEPGAEPYYFLDKDLTTPLMPQEGQTVVVYKNSFTLHTPFSK